ncbi:MAG: hypothetical protein IMY77_02590 [Chloroflexi bacterium]|nr:hypothetical protein [Chloroflexota bacterium]
MRKFAILTVGIITASLLLAVPLSGCQGEVGFTTASLGDATMCKSVDETTMKPIEATNVFTPDTPVICCSVKLSNAPDDTEVKAEWIYVEGETEGMSNYLIDEVSVIAEGTRYLGFSLPRPDTGWPRGGYKVVLYVDGKEAKSVSFSVE